MVFGPWIEVFLWVKSLVPDFSSFRFKIPRPHFSFILLHYIYILSLTIIASIILYGSLNLAYIDALFFASGAATQSGLNTVNVNDLHIYQQVTLTLIAGIANPIFINTFVVFIRLYWFEKRFQNVVLEAYKNRRSRERSRVRGNPPDDRGSELEVEERGFANKKIAVVNPGDETMQIAEHVADERLKSIDEVDTTSESSTSEPSSSTKAAQANGKDGARITSRTSGEAEGPKQDSSPVQPSRRGIVFADELEPAPRDGLDREAMSSQLPANKKTADDHIAFLENQRNPKDKGTLYIPSPRDFERGRLPEEIGDEDGSSRAGDDQIAHAHPPARPSTDHSEELSRFGSFDEKKKRVHGKYSLGNAAHSFAKFKHKIMSYLVPQPEDSEPEKEAEDDGRAVRIHNRRRDDESDNAYTLRRRGRVRSFASFITTQDDDSDSLPYLSYQATIGRNSTFVNLTEEQREELGGIEYRALKSLAVVLCVYYFGFHLLGVICLVPWIVRSQRYSALVVSDGASPTWWGFFTSASMFNDLGYTLTPDSMVSFEYAILPLVLGSYLIIIGNTGFPCMLRFVIWVMSKLVRRGSALWEEYRFLLDHPRRCFTLLFPSRATWWLFWVLVLLNGLDLLFFIVLDLGNTEVSALPPGIRVLSGWFQAVSTRTAGFNVVDLADLHPGIQVSYLIMMYISVFPIAISVRRTNVYEEKSLGVWQAQDEDDEDGDPRVHSYIGNHLRRQLSFDLWFVFLGLFIIAIAEGGRIQNSNDYAFTLFSCLFEVVSAYGTVGLSLGYPGIDASFSAEFSVISKLVIIAMQIRGRHRGLPYALDKAILLPSEESQAKEAELAMRRMQRTGTMASVRSNRTTTLPNISTVPTVPRDDSHTHENEEDIGPACTATTTRRQSGLSVSSAERRNRRRSGFAKLLESAFTAGPAAKQD